MAKTKFLDYTGLAKLVEKIKNTYVNKNEQYEANLKWGGGNFADSFGPIDAAMIPELGANRFAFGNPRGITVEYSNDGGSTWHDYGASDEQKLRLTTIGDGFTIGKVKSSTPANDMLRVTLNTTVDGINCYTILNKFCIYIYSQGSDGCYCTIQVAKQESPTVFLNKATNVPLAGWGGYNIINVDGIITSWGDNTPEYYGRIRFIFGNTGNTTDYPGMSVNKIYAFGGMGWRVPSNLASRGSLYSYDESQNATFPANITATNFIGNASSASKLGTATVGSATKPMYLNGGTPTACTYTLAQNVTSASKLTDTTYSASTGLSLSKDNKFSINAATSSTIGGVKIGSNITVSDGTISLTKGNVVNALGYTPPTADTNTHYTTGLIVGNSSSSTGNTAVTTNGVFLNLKDDNHIRNSHKIVGGGGTTVTSDSGGTITISSTTYKDATISEHGLMTAADKVKLNSLAKVATSGSYADLSNKPTIPTSLPANGGKADSATQDSSGQKITSTYIKGLSVNGTTITYTKGDNSSGTINTQDTNTTYTFTNGTDGTFTVKASNSTKAQTISVGKTASASTADNAVNAQTAETANKLSVNAGSDMTPIYFKDGVPKPCDSTLGVNINGRASTASLASKLSVGAGSGSGNNVLLLGNYEGGPIFMGGGVGPGEFTPTDIIAKDGDYYRLNVYKANTANSATTAGTANTASKLSVDGGNTSTNEVLVLGNYTNSTFTPSGIVSKITDPDIENEIKKTIVWPTA